MMMYSHGTISFLTLIIIITYVKSSNSIDVETLLSNMSLSEKLGQMTQLNIDTILDDDKQNINTTRLHHYAELHIGSYLNTPFASPNNNSSFTGKAGLSWSVSDWRRILGQIQRATIDASPHGIPMIYGIDNVHGANYVTNATLFGHQLSVAASFNPSLVRQMGVITAKETAAAGLHWIFGPVLDLGLEKRWARMYETFGEDPHLASVLGTAIISGIQSSGKVSACMKHFMGYGIPEAGHDRANTRISDFELLNVHLPPFLAAVTHGNVRSVMESYNSINGEPVVSSHKILQSLLRHDIGFHGLLVTDWGEINNLVNFHHQVTSEREAVARVMAQTSVDMSMVPYDANFMVHLESLIRLGQVNMSRIDASVRRILQTKVDAGLFDLDAHEEHHEENLNHPIVAAIGSEEDQQVALDLARESIVVLENYNHTLPIKGVHHDHSKTNNTSSSSSSSSSTKKKKKKNAKTKIFVTGPNAASVGRLCGGWTVHWQGTREDDRAFKDHGQSILEGMQSVFPSSEYELVYHPGVDVNGQSMSPAGEEESIVAPLVHSAEYTVVVLGEDTYAEKPGDITDVDLPRGQWAYVERLVALAPATRLIVILVSGRPRLLRGYVEHRHQSPGPHSNIGALIFAGLPCEQGGQAIAEILAGTVNPSGRLPFTYARASSNVNLPYFHLQSTLCFGSSLDNDGQGLMPGEAQAQVPCQAQWPFGHGLSYTSFTYDALALEEVVEDDQNTTLRVSVCVTNAGSVRGQEVVLVFVFQQTRLRHVPDRKRLRGFKKLTLDPGESKVVQINLGEDAWSYYEPHVGHGLQLVTEPGLYYVGLGPHVDCLATSEDALCRSWTIA